MTTMDKVNKIKADIEALPVEYRSLILAEKTWAMDHPYLYAGGLIVLGAVLLPLVQAL